MSGISPSTSFSSLSTPTLLCQFGSEGEGDGQFKYPTGVALDRMTGCLFVADYSNNRIQVFRASDGAFLRQFGSRGAGEGCFVYPSGLAVDSSNGHLFVGDFGNHRVQVLRASDGTFLRSIGGLRGAEDGQFNRPYGVAVDAANDLLYVTDFGNHRLQVFRASDGLFLRKLGAKGAGESQFNSPSGIAVDALGDCLYVADTLNNRVQVFRASTFAFLRQFGCSGASDAKFNSPYGLALDSANDSLYVTDSSNNRVQVFRASSGSFLRKFGAKGNGDGQFASPSSIVFDKATFSIFVSDNKNHRIQVFRCADASSPLLYSSSSSSSSSSLFIPSSALQETVSETYELRERVRQLETALDGSQADTVTACKQLTSSQEILISQQERQELSERMITQLRQQLESSQTELTHTRQQLQAAHQQLQAAQTRITHLESQWASSIEAQTSLRNSLQTAQQQNAQFQSEITQFQEEIGRLEDEKARLQASLSSSTSSSSPSSSSSSSSSPSSSGDRKKGIAADWMYPLEQVKLPPSPALLGSGALGQVLAGSWLGTPVALKRTHLLDPGNTEMAALVREMSEAEKEGLVDTFLNECHMTARLRHPNIVLFLGLVVDSMASQRPLYLMMEYVSGGTLHRLLYPGISTVSFTAPSSPTLTVSPSASASMSATGLTEDKKREILLDIARGLRYLHSQDPPVLHLDIKPSNILMTREGRAKLGDFGEAHVIQSSTTLRRQQTSSASGPGTVSVFGRGTLDYMAPEMHVTTAKKTGKVDMFSFGVLVAEMGAEKPPQPGSKIGYDDQQRQVVFSELERRAEDLAAITSPRWRELAINLLKDHPDPRWDVEQVMRFLQTS